MENPRKKESEKNECLGGLPGGTTYQRYLPRVAYMLFTQFSIQIHYFQTNSGNIVCTPYFSAGGGSNQIFKKGFDRISIFRGELLGKRG